MVVQAHFLHQLYWEWAAAFRSCGAIFAAPAAPIRVILRMTCAAPPAPRAPPPLRIVRSDRWHCTFNCDQHEPDDDQSRQIVSARIPWTRYLPESVRGVGGIFLGPVFVLLCPLRHGQQHTSCSCAEVRSCLLPSYVTAFLTMAPASQPLCPPPCCLKHKEAVSFASRGPRRVARKVPVN